PAGSYNRQNPSQNTAHIWLVDVETGARRKLAAHDDRPYLDETPSYLADGRIAIQSNRTGRMEIWIIGVDGSAIQITRNPQSSAQLQFPPEPRNDSRGRFGYRRICTSRLSSRMSVEAGAEPSRCCEK
ncbi:MAG TPA: hypothetical protein VFB99_19240, partial [Vicinamibacterales bacterium]|nr:hypothetical protein [Vicinamibacterales bacterium]